MIDNYNHSLEEGSNVGGISKYILRKATKGISNYGQKSDAILDRASKVKRKAIEQGSSTLEAQKKLNKFTKRAFKKAGM